MSAYLHQFKPVILQLKNSHPRDADISFEEVTHKYTILDGSEKYISVTTLIHTLFEKFDSDSIIKKMMKGKNWNSSNKYWNMTPEEIKQQWSNNALTESTGGTNLHYQIECFMNQDLNSNNNNDDVLCTHETLYEKYLESIKTTSVTQTTLFNKDIVESVEWNFFLNFVTHFPNFQPYRTEWMIYDSQYKIAGSIDMIYKNDDGTLSIYDWKRVKEINKTSSWIKYSILECINHIPDTNYWHYSIQLNMYKYILEKNYDVIIKDLYLVRLHPNNIRKSFDLIKLPILTFEIQEILRTRMETITTKNIL